MNKTASILVGVGAIAAVLGIVWSTVVFPGYERIPDDFVRIDEFIGSYTVVDPIVSQVQANAAITQLRADPSNLEQLRSPATLESLSSPALPKLLGSEALRPLLADPAKLQQLLGNPQAAAKVVPADLLPILADPVVVPLLTNPAVLALLGDPEAMELILDPRAIALLTDPTALPTVTVPVVIHRERHATDTDGDTLFVRETVETTMADRSTGRSSGVQMPGFPKTDLLLALDSKTRGYVPETEGERTGSLSFPFNVETGKTYSLYVNAAGQPLATKYVRTESREGLEVMVFQISASDRPMGTHPQLGLPLVADSEITVWVEPRSGRVVDTEDKGTTVSAKHPLNGKLTVFVSDLKLSPESVTEQIAAAKDDKAQLALYGTYVPFGLIIAGIVIAAGGVFAGWTRWKKTVA